MLRKAEGVLNRLIQKSWWRGDKKRRGDILLSASSVIRTRCLSALSWPGADFHSDSFPVFVEGLDTGFHPLVCVVLFRVHFEALHWVCAEICVSNGSEFSDIHSATCMSDLCVTQSRLLNGQSVFHADGEDPPLHVLALRIWTLQWRSALSKMNPLKCCTSDLSWGFTWFILLHCRTALVSMAIIYSSTIILSNSAWLMLPFAETAGHSCLSGPCSVRWCHNLSELLTATEK